MQLKFGFLAEPTCLEWSAGGLAPLPEFSKRVAALQEHERVYDGWIYPPLQPSPATAAETRNPPLVEATAFSLLPTHELALEAYHAEDEFAHFVIALLGMLMGLRLVPEGWQHFYRAPICRGKLCDFYATDSEIASALDVATQFWNSHANTNVRKLAFGAIHWHLFAQLYKHEFERFSAQYTALDACYRLARSTVAGFKKTSHSRRAAALCCALKVPAPTWARMEADERPSTLAERRNALIHEGLYADAPIGFAHPSAHPRMELELTGLVARLLLSILGIQNEYTRSECTTRQTIGFSFRAE